MRLTSNDGAVVSVAVWVTLRVWRVGGRAGKISPLGPKRLPTLVQWKFPGGHSPLSCCCRSGSKCTCLEFENEFVCGVPARKESCGTYEDGIPNMLLNDDEV